MIGLILHFRDKASVQVYTVHEPPVPAADRIDRAAELVFVKDGFSWGAALFSPIYFLVKGHWLGLAAYTLAATVLFSLVGVFELGEVWAGLVLPALNIFIGFESPSLERASLHWRGWREIGTVTGRNAHECERRFFEDWLERQPVISSLITPHPPRSGFTWQRAWRWSKRAGA